MASNNNPTVRRRRLGMELRKLREAMNMTAEQVAARLLVSQSKISRLENGRRSISPRDVRDLCEVYEVTDTKIVESLMQMARESRQQGWWNAYGDIPYSVYIGFETDAASLRVFAPQVVPGLLQTRPYAEAVIRGVSPETAEENIQNRIEVRMRRQERVTGEAQRQDETKKTLGLWAVIDESALRRVVGSRQVMREQLEHLVEMSQLPHITVQLLPFGGGAHPGLNGGYSILEFPDATDTSVIYLEGVTSDLYLEKPHDLQKYGLIFEHLRAQAENPDQTRQLISDIAKEYAR